MPRAPKKNTVQTETVVAPSTPQYAPTQYAGSQKSGTTTTGSKKKA
jgi:hypothetical protein